jgi:hypothetical protein
MKKSRKTRCPYCAKLVAVRKNGKMYAHRDPATKNPCYRRSPA